MSLEKGKIDLVKYLVEHGADVNLSNDHHSTTPLTIACLNRNKEIVEYLLEHGADVHAKENDGDSSLKIVRVLHFPKIE